MTELFVNALAAGRPDNAGADKPDETGKPDNVGGGPDMTTQYMGDENANDIVVKTHAGSYAVDVGEGNDTVTILGAVTGTGTIDLGAGDDKLISNGGNVDVTGGEGNDHYAVNGSAHNTFHFKFSVDTELQKFTEYFRDGGTPNIQNADGQAWANYAKQLEAWRDALEDQYGNDRNTTDGLFTVMATTSTKKTVLNTTYKDLDNSFTFEKEVTTVTSADGHDTIKGFNDGDRLDFGGITSLKMFNYFFSVSLADADGDGGLDDTVIALKSGGFKLDILNSDLSMEQIAKAAGWDFVA
jgi:hypothetical protein